MLTYCALEMLQFIFKRKYRPKNLLITRFCSTQSLSVRESESCEPKVEPVPTFDTKLLKIAIIGAPNAGKSTLINRIVDRRVFAISKKVHTTRCRARAMYTEGNTQLLFLDTPGLVTATETKKFNLSKEFLSGGEDAIEEADIIGAVHDGSNPYARFKLDPKLLRLLHLYSHKESFLVINKVDTLKSKRVLLDMSVALSGGKLRDYSAQPKTMLSERGIAHKIASQPAAFQGFSDVFMVSALLGTGVLDIRRYLVGGARPGDWVLPKDQITDLSSDKLLSEAVRASLLEHLPHEVPYSLSVIVEYMEYHEGRMEAVVLIGCRSARLLRMVKGGRGERIRRIAMEAEENLRDSLKSEVRLRLVISDSFK